MNALTIDNILSNRKNLERILDNMKDGIIAHDMSRRIFYFNKKAEEITGYRREDVVGKDCHESPRRPFLREPVFFLRRSADLSGHR
jgi:PAS domain S-box-containing protein